MRIGLDDNTTTEKDKSAQSDGLADLIKEGTGSKKPDFSSLSGKKKAEYIWDYYKWWIIGTIVGIIALTTFVRDYIENSKPTYLYVEMLNTYFGADSSNTLYDDFVEAAGIDLSKEQLTIGTDVTLLADNYDSTMIAFQQRLVANYAAQALDVVIAPRDIIEGPANCDNYADLEKILPRDLLDDLAERDYEMYVFDPSKDEIEDSDEEDVKPYVAGVYLDNCAYLNNMGDSGAYPVAEKDGDRPVFTIAGNSLRTDHAIEFLRFLIK